MHSALRCWPLCVWSWPGSSCAPGMQMSLKIGRPGRLAVCVCACLPASRRRSWSEWRVNVHHGVLHSLWAPPASCLSFAPACACFAVAAPWVRPLSPHTPHLTSPSHTSYSPPLPLLPPSLESTAIHLASTPSFSRPSPLSRQPHFLLALLGAELHGRCDLIPSPLTFPSFGILSERHWPGHLQQQPRRPALTINFLSVSCQV